MGPIVTRGRLALAAVLGLGVACAAPEVEGTWLATDLHVHSSVGSNDTDGLGTAEALAGAMATAGLDAVWITDHSNSAGSMHCDDVEDCPNLGPELPEADWPAGVYLGSEISPRDTGSEPRGHVGCLPRDGAFADGFEAFVDRPFGAIRGGDAVSQCHDAGGFAVVNHPFSSADWLDYDWTSEDFDALEVYNGTLGYDRQDALGLAAWEERVAAGRDLVLLGGSDCHRWGSRTPGRGLDPALGWPTTRVLVRDDESLLDAIVDGRAVVVEPGTRLELTAWVGRVAAAPGESLPRAGRWRIVASAEEPGMVVELREVGGDALASAPLDGEVTLEGDLPEGVWYARVWPASGEVFAAQGGVAMTNAIRVGRSGP